MARTTILVSTQIKDGLARSIAAGDAPRRDYFELQKLLDAELMSPPPPTGAFYKLLGKIGGTALAMAVAAWRRRNDYDIILTDQEAVGLILALLFKMTRTRRGHVMISHYLTPTGKQMFYRLLRVHSDIDVTVCYSSAQARLAEEKLGLSAQQMSMVLHPADSNFWRPAASHAETQADFELLRQAGIYLPEHAQVVSSAGLEFRDYPTLMEAVDSLPRSVRVVIAAASPWSKRKNTTVDVKLPDNVQRVMLTPRQLRALYRRSQVVAIPLYDVDFQAGSLVAYEAMACGKPVVITRTRGQGDIVQEGKTGLYVPPGDAHAMAGAINRLLADPGTARSLGDNARSVVEHGLNLDVYLAKMAGLVQNVIGHHSLDLTTDEYAGEYSTTRISTAKQEIR